ncbi:glycerol-3-phosphate acyltransferase PlsY [Halopseudomonas xinjiangensis]|uniref:Glycerol-3-phosphate acyltransferase n=1 Tax=Halopseudomonas xinjiangensis TaxID=487184 RepID=A0A1H1Z1G5_9GAMM|nr:glycerol-3-phosphate 1-O-acyltransferase PlsY [Halopseudomonas xinjiangensis]SDT27574.1 glycerol-3-phosphate acyltransferase PlsY [Halopseudomonas xinjiangensis]
MPAKFVILLCIAYLLGSVSFAVLLSRLGRLPDPRYSGSGNPGASNMLRLGHRQLALATLVGDWSKGAAAVWIAARVGLSPPQQGWVALAAIIGHILPIFHQFRGGKGVATAGGALMLLSWPATLIAAVLWLAVFLIKRIASLASLAACAGLLPWFAWRHPQLLLPILLMVSLILLRHRLNIGRLLSGTENDFRR